MGTRWMICLRRREHWRTSHGLILIENFFFPTFKGLSITFTTDDGHVVQISHTGIRWEGTPQETALLEKEGKRRLDVLKGEYALSQPRSKRIRKTLAFGDDYLTSTTTTTSATTTTTTTSNDYCGPAIF